MFDRGRGERPGPHRGSVGVRAAGVEEEDGDDGGVAPARPWRGGSTDAAAHGDDAKLGTRGGRARSRSRSVVGKMGERGGARVSVWTGWGVSRGGLMGLAWLAAGLVGPVGGFFFFFFC